MEKSNDSTGSNTPLKRYECGQKGYVTECDDWLRGMSKSDNLGGGVIIIFKGENAVAKAMHSDFISFQGLGKGMKNSGYKNADGTPKAEIMLLYTLMNFNFCDAYAAIQLLRDSQEARGCPLSDASWEKHKQSVFTRESYRRLIADWIALIIERQGSQGLSQIAKWCEAAERCATRNLDRLEENMICAIESAAECRMEIPTQKNVRDAYMRANPNDNITPETLNTLIHKLGFSWLPPDVRGKSSY